MHSFFINKSRLLENLFASGAITMDDVRSALATVIEHGEKPNHPVGYAPTGRGSTCSAFIATDKETGKIQTDVNGNVRLNLRDSRKR